jgi:hypothetical protein
MAIEYIRIEDINKINYLLCGFSTNRKVISELTYPIYVDHNSIFYFAVLNNNVIGFCSAIKNKNKIVFSHDYVIYEYRKKGIYCKLFDMRYNDFKYNNVYAVCTKNSINTFLRYGFNIQKITKNYTFVNKN